MAPFGKLLLTVPAVLVLCGASDERGKIACSVDDEHLNFTVHASFSYRGNKPLFGIEGKLDVKPPGVRIAAPSLAIKNEHLIQQWFYDTDLRLQFYVPTTDGTVSFSLMTTMNKEGGTYAGSYDLEIDPAEGLVENTYLREGKINCKMD
jgi:hypothetical protein